jgi:hypothetical protein
MTGTIAGFVRERTANEHLALRHFEPSWTYREYVTLCAQGAGFLLAPFAGAHLPEVVVAPGDIFSLILTSRSTGAPKFSVSQVLPRIALMLREPQHERFRPSRTTPEPAHPEALEG